MDKTGSFTFHTGRIHQDFNRRLSLPNLVNMVIEAAGMHADGWGYGIDSLLGRGLSWVISRISAKFIRNPAINDKIRIETWVDQVQELFTIRKYNIYDSRDNLFSSFATLWTIINFGTRRIQPVRQIIGEEFLTGRNDFFAPEPDKIQNPGTDTIAVRNFKVLYSSIDINKHLTTVKYIQWALDMFPPEVHRDMKLKTFMINFISESVYGDVLEASLIKLNDENEFIVDMKNPESGKLLCRSKLIWEI